MSLNTAHASNGVLIHSGEYILTVCETISMEFFGQRRPEFQGTKNGLLYFTTHRLIFINVDPIDLMQSFSIPFITLYVAGMDLDKMDSCSNNIECNLCAQPCGNFCGEVSCKIHFKNGGSHAFGRSLIYAARTIQFTFCDIDFKRNLPPYRCLGSWHPIQPTGYEPPASFYDWIPKHRAFNEPDINTVFVTDHAVPYPGIEGPFPLDAVRTVPSYCNVYFNNIRKYSPATPQLIQYSTWNKNELIPCGQPKYCAIEQDDVDVKDVPDAQTTAERPKQIEKDEIHPCRVHSKVYSKELAKQLRRECAKCYELPPIPPKVEETVAPKVVAKPKKRPPRPKPKSPKKKCYKINL